jgi:hypothetical protein
MSNIDTMIPTFRFASLRSPKPKKKIFDPNDPNLPDVEPTTALVASIININESTDTNAQKLAAANTLLQNYVSGPHFIKTTTEFRARINPAQPNSGNLELLYDNMLVRLLTKSNTNEVYALLVNTIRDLAASCFSVATDRVRIIIPERLTFTFNEFAGTNTVAPPSNEAEQLRESIGRLNNALNKIREARVANVVSFDSGKQYTKVDKRYTQILQAMSKSQVKTTEADAYIRKKLAAADKRIKSNRTFPQTDDSLSGKSTLSNTETLNVSQAVNEHQIYVQLRAAVQQALADKVEALSDTQRISDSYYADVLTAIDERGPLTLDAADKKMNRLLTQQYDKLNVLLPGRTYALVAGSWKDVSRAATGENVFEDDTSSIVVYSQGCALKYPVQVADLRVVEQQPVGYLPGEIAHISNTQRGEKNTRVTRRLKKVETAETIINENEVVRETDSQSSERFSIENDASQVQQEENSSNVNATVSYSMGPLSASVNGGYSSSSLSLSSNSTAQTYGKEILIRIVDRVSNRTRVERSLKTIEEFEETVTHEIDNSTQETKSYVYRWLNKLVRGTLKNYGKRLIFEFDVAHPAHYYLWRLMKDSVKPTLNIPADPRTYAVGGVVFTPSMINASNYVSWGKMYNVKLDAPPEPQIIVSEVFNGQSGSIVTGKTLDIKRGYACKHANVRDVYATGWPGGNFLAAMVGMSTWAFWSGGDDFYTTRTCWLNDEKEKLPISIWQGSLGFLMHVEIFCDLTPEALNEWQMKCYYDILDGYDKLKTEAEAKVNSFDPNAPGLPPDKKLELVRTELKKEAIRKMFRCNPFWVNDNFEVGQEYNPDCCSDSAYAEQVKFIETVFDWQNLTYELYPYFYNNKSQWDKLLNLTDDDAHFEAFLRASYATVRVPVFRDGPKEIAACNFIVNNAIGNYETIPGGLEGLLDELATEPASLFTYDLDGNQIAVPKTTVDLGIFTIPTSLVILECGNQDGVKPIGFPQVDADNTDVEIAKQYSPAIIADNCKP